MPHQYGLSTRTDTEAVSRLLRAATEACPRATILSVDAGCAFDHVSRGAMLGALHASRAPLLPSFARQFYSSPSVYIHGGMTTYDDGCAHDVGQGEGGEQGDPLMPAFYALAQHDTLCDLQRQLGDGEAVFAFFDDVYIIALPEWIRALYDALSAALWGRAQICLHEGKTRIWNAASTDVGFQASTWCGRGGERGANQSVPSCSKETRKCCKKASWPTMPGSRARWSKQRGASPSSGLLRGNATCVCFPWSM